MTMFSKVCSLSEQDTNDCIMTPTGLDTYGYGQCRQGMRMRKAHHVALEHSGRTLPEGMVVRHTCDNCACINPRHLVVGTNDENMQDMVKRGRASREKQRTAVLNWEKVREIRSSTKSPEELSAIYGVRKQQVKRILKGDAWQYES